MNIPENYSKHRQYSKQLCTFGGNKMHLIKTQAVASSSGTYTAVRKALYRHSSALEAWQDWFETPHP